MKKNIVLYYAFLKSEQQQPFALFSTDSKLFVDYLSKQTDLIYSFDSVVVKMKKDERVHTALSFIPVDTSVLTAFNVSNVKELYTWIQIQGNTYIPTESWEIFLFQNSLLSDWIHGRLTVDIGHYYKELSKDFGFRENFKKESLLLNSYNHVWSFHELFKGSKKTTYGEMASYSYTQDKKLLCISLPNKTIAMHQDWLDKFNPQQKVYSLRELKLGVF